MMGWTDNERTDVGQVDSLASLIQAVINAAFAAVTIIAGVLVVCGGLFADAPGGVRFGAVALGVGAIVAGGLMGRRD